MAEDTASLGDVPERVGAILRRRVGPAPLGVWVAVGAVVVAVAAAVYRRRNPRPVEPDADTAPVGDDDPTAAGSPPVRGIPTGFTVGTTGGATNTAPYGSTNTDNGVNLSTNYDWRQRAEAYAIGRGFAPTIVVEAVGRFLSGESLTAQQRSIIDIIMAHVGSPPEPVPPPLVIDSPAPDTSTVPPSTPTTPAPGSATNPMITKWYGVVREAGNTRTYGGVSPFFNTKTEAQDYLKPILERARRTQPSSINWIIHTSSQTRPANAW